MDTPSLYGMERNAMDYTIRIEDKQLAFVLDGKAIKTYPIIQAESGKAFIPLQALILIQTMEDEGFHLKGLEYPQKTMN